MIDGVLLTPQRVIDVSGGDVLHVMKQMENGYSGFGEAYFSMVESGTIKGWKKHNQMVLNLVVPIGEVRFVLFDDREGSATAGEIMDIKLSQSHYSRLTLPSGIWFAFQGISSEISLLLNIASIPHDPDEIERKGIDEIEFDWRT